MKQKRHNKILSPTAKPSHSNSRETAASQKKRNKDHLRGLRWGLVPAAAVCLLVLDAVGIYIFNTERLLVLGIGLMIILLPCFSEVTIKDFTVRRDKPEE